MGLAALTLLAWLGLSAPRAQTEGTVRNREAVEVRADPVGARDARTVGDLMRAQALFTRFQSLAPQAQLRIRVLARLDANHADRFRIAVMARTGRIDVALDELSRFEIPAEWAGLPPDTVIRSLLRDGAVTWRSDVRTPGLPAHVRRLGDLRLQCKLDWGVPLGRRGFVPQMSQFASADALCGSASTGAMNSQFADRPVLAIDLVHGDRREQLSYFFMHGAGDNGPTRMLSGPLDWRANLRDHMYRLPIEDRSWPDDTWVVFTYMEPGAIKTKEETP